MKTSLLFATALCATATWAEVTSIDPPEKAIEQTGGAAMVTLSGSGQWTAETDADWIHLLNASGAVGTTPFAYTVDENPSADTRVGVIDISGLTHTVTQKGLPATLSANSAAFDDAGGQTTVEVTVDTGVSWSVKHAPDWVTVAPETASGPATVTLTIAPYTGRETRTAELAIAGQTFTVTQTGVAATLSPTQATADMNSTIIQVTVTADAETAWRAETDADWLSFPFGAEGKGTGTLLVVVASNPSVKERQGIVSVGGATLTVTQAGTQQYALVLAPETGTVAPTGGDGTVEIVATPDLEWSVATQQTDWLTVNQKEGAGSGQVTYHAAPNPETGARTGTIRVSAQLPEPTIDLSRALTRWNGDDGYVNNGEGSSRDWKDDSSEAMAFTLTSLGIIHPLFDLTIFNDVEKGSLYINAANHLVFQDTVSTQVSDFVVESNVRYKVFFVRGNRQTDIYVGKDTEGPAIKLFTTGILDISKMGETTYPTPGKLVDGTVEDSDYWERTLSEAEVQAAIKQTNRPKAAKDTSKAPYEGLDFFYSLDGWGDLEPTLDHRLHLTEDRYGWYGGAYKGALQSWDETLINQYDLNWWKSTKPAYASSDLEGQGFLREADAEEYAQNGALEAARETLSGRSDNEAYAESVTYNFWCKWDAFVEGPLFGCTIYTRTYTTEWEVVDQGTGVLMGERYKIKKSRVTFAPTTNPSHKTYLTMSSDGAIKLLDKAAPLPCALGQWHMVSLVINEKNYELYLDGIQILSTEGDAFGTGYPQFWELSGGLEVAYDDMEVYKRRLTGSEIAAIYTAEKPLEAVHTVTQDEQTLEVSGDALNLVAAGESRALTVSAGANQTWTATCEADWVSFAPASGTGNGTVTVTAAANQTTAFRSAIATIAGQEVTISQLGQKATIEANTSTVIGSEGGELTFTVDLGEGIAWEADSDSTWAQVTQGASGNGTGTVTVTIEKNPDSAFASRTDAIEIAGETIYVTQRDFDVSITPEHTQITNAATQGEIAVTAPDNAQWDVLATVNWLTPNAAVGIGQTTLAYTVAENTTGVTRTGMILIAGVPHTVTQSAGAVVTVATVGEGSVSGGGTVPDGTEVTLTATPAEGYVFSHWTGDATGTANPLTFTAEGAMSVVAHFVPQAAVDAQVEAAIEAGGYVTKDQVKDLSFGAPIIDVEGDSVKVGIRLQSANSLSGNPTWETVKPDAAEADAEGVISVTLPREGNAAFYRFLSPEAEAETPTDPEP